MPRFFVNELTETVVLSGDDARHIARSLRMKPGDTLMLCDGKGGEATAAIAALSPDAVTLRVGEVGPAAEPQTRVTLYLALPKGDKLEWVVQKAVELGVAELVVLLTSRCVSRPDARQGAKKMERLQKIAAEAAGQSGRGILPVVRGILEYPDALAEMQQFSTAFALYEGSCPPLRRQLSLPASPIALLVGPEGGFSADEIEKAKQAGILPASLGPRILRCETAPIAALSAVMFAAGEMD